MGKKKQTYIGVGPDGSDIICDSQNEVHFTWWMKELYDRGFIDHYKRNNVTLVLCEGVKTPREVFTKRKGKLIPAVKPCVVVKKKEYTFDFTIDWNAKAIDILLSCRKDLMFNECTENSSLSSYVEVKPSFDFKNMSRLAETNVVFAYVVHGVVIDIIVPSGPKECLFDETFTPNRFLFQDNNPKKSRKIPYKNVRTIDQFIAMKASAVVQESILGSDKELF